MGRRSAVDAVVSGGDSSQSSGESSFRELDDVFLQVSLIYFCVCSFEMILIGNLIFLKKISRGKQECGSEKC